MIEDEETVDFLSGLDIPNEEGRNLIEEMAEWDQEPEVDIHLSHGDKQLDLENSKRNRKKRMVQFLTSGDPYKSFHVAFAVSKHMVTFLKATITTTELQRDVKT
ncbi:hypothetical protein OnM2_067062 [Erysiphe neolycopersici]|uniref:Uncharacterized protein n=1 Tax=Erysiphe neolycopersici TaxID=212602 RepID=A0A420HM47_9PEZI|nr:hypothetical protein OnM2_067062 [Erysiphe neolycopersici]